MIKWLVLLTACIISLADGLAAARPGPDSNYNISVSAGGGGSNNTAIDASVQGSQAGSGTTCTASITTTNATDVVIAYVSANSASNISAGATFSGGGLTWSSDTTVTNTPTNTQADTMGHAITSATLSAQTITATLPAAISYCTLMVWAISGANTSSPFDGSNVSGNTAPQSITTTNANDMIVAGWGANSTAAPTVGACCTIIKSGNFQASEFVKETTTGTVSMNTANNADARAMIVSAIKSQ